MSKPFSHLNESFRGGDVMLSIGKRRGLAQCSTPRGTFAVLALDHRGNLRHALNPQNPDAVSYSEMVSFKQQVVAALGPASSAVLLDPEMGAAPMVATDALPGSTGLLVALEATGYTGDPNARLSRVLPGWSVGKIQRMGASGVKLLVYYHPEAPIASHQEDLTSQIAEACVRFDIPLFVEPLSYSLDPDKKLSSAEKRQIVIETARRLTPMGIDILKAEFPVDVKEEKDEQVWAQACAELNAASQVPWTLLSAGVDYDTYMRQVAIACRAGASGVLAGRAVWKEATELQGVARLDFLRTTAAERMNRLYALCDALGKPWSEHYTPQTTPENWYSSYADIA
jgi:tagatose 1,6-diphosphate aldolase